ncbi:MAG: hypothetical protein HC853_16265 [Anaerolineae bacterium]|nr:hypothetical protein [Anaerolineae bacterium]
MASPLNSPLPNNAPDGLDYPKPSAGKGAITGRLVTMLNGLETGYKGGDLYLGVFFAGSKADAPLMVSVSPDTDPKAVVYGNDGRFAFTDIAPGTYTLVVWNPTTSFVVEKPGEGAVKSCGGCRQGGGCRQHHHSVASIASIASIAFV